MSVYNLTIKKGATFNKNIAYKDNEDVAIDLTGYTARMQIRQYYKREVIHELTTENGGITITGATGEIELLITATDTDSIHCSSALYDIELINGVEVIRLLEGKVSISENVTI